VAGDQEIKPKTKRRDVESKPRKRRRRQDDPAAERSERESRPAFAAHYPADPELDALLEAFTEGDYGHIRKEAPALAQRTEDDAIRRAALDLRRRISPDPTSTYLVLIAVGLLLLLAYYYAVYHGGQ